MRLFKFIFSILILGSCLLVPATAQDEKDHTHLRRDMVARQIKGRGIKDKSVLSAMETVPRHAFVPPGKKAAAYEDRPLAIGFGQTISQPYIVALMTELLKLDKSARVLEVGTGSGYQAAILAMTAKEVYSIEIVQPLHQRSSKVLEKLGYRNIFTTHGDGYYGWEPYGPYDAIIVTCASEFVPPPLIRQLKPGGRMCIPVGPPFKVQHLVLIEKGKNTELTTTIIGSVRFVPLVRDIN
ncbi:protein-L-isoaspartate(D-aspartate) O-methyltransferase [Desulfobacula sp.]|uniref:protein-L-isoaspartate(D-aspartate) O-methyltransferase n=1 Tax=Desulfobacula sp. TaxID=2593537 RepID=UPI002633F973|nr:protein-L-isoaspartate(D-aspartate) O-methyltransferase [Desulfobacula sp.]